MKNERETWRMAIATQTCPLCKRGPFVSLANHVSQKHELSGNDIRELAHLPKQASICAPEFGETRREMAMGNPLPRTKPGRTYERNSYGREMCRRAGKASGVARKAADA